MRIRYYLPALIILAAAVCGLGQAGGDPPLITKNWSELAAATEGPRGFTLLSRDMRNRAEGRFELSIKVVPNNIAAFNRMYGITDAAVYVVLQAEVDCQRKLVEFERPAAYDRGNNILKGGTGSLGTKVNRERVKPGSVAAVMFEKICVSP